MLSKTRVSIPPNPEGLFPVSYGAIELLCLVVVPVSFQTNVTSAVCLVAKHLAERLHIREQPISYEVARVLVRVLWLHIADR